MGGQIIHYEMLEIVKEMEKIPDLEKLIDIKAIEFVNHADLTQFINKEMSRQKPSTRICSIRSLKRQS